MVEVRRYSQGCKEEWDNFNNHSKYQMFMFNRDYMDYHNDRFVDHSLIFYDEKGKVIALMPCSEHGEELKSHGGLTYGGFITDENMRQNLMMECFEAMKLYCKNNGIRQIEYKAIPHIYHLQPAEEDIYALCYFGASITKIEASTVINLTNPIKMSKLRRRQIKKSSKEGVLIDIDDSKEAYDEFMKLQDDVLLERHNVHAVHTAKEMYMLHECFSENIHLYTAKKYGQIIGGAILYIYKNVIHTQYLCASNEARINGALDAVVDRIIDDNSHSKLWLDFGISTEQGGHSLNEGLINQKEGFGGRTEVYYTWNFMWC